MENEGRLYTDSVSVWTVLEILHSASEFEAIQSLMHDIVKKESLTESLPQ